jgi:hypothetical protein
VGCIVVDRLRYLTGREPETPELTPFLVTKEHRRFTEFADACRQHRYIGLCHGAPGVGKTLSARRYACWDDLEPRLLRWGHHFTEGRHRDEWNTVFYTPTVNASPRVIDTELRDLSQRLGVLRVGDPFDRRTYNKPHGSSARSPNCSSSMKPTGSRCPPWSSCVTTTTAATSA